MENRWGDNRSTQSNLSSYGDTVKLFIQGIPFAVFSIGFIWKLFGISNPIGVFWDSSDKDSFLL